MDEYSLAFAKTLNKYTITFFDEDGNTVLQSGQLEYGTTPSFAGQPPVKTGDVQYSYTFSGWSPAVTAVTGDASYTASYTRTLNAYTVTFFDEDGTTVLQSSDVPYGETPAYTEKTPEKTATAQYTDQGTDQSADQGADQYADQGADQDADQSADQDTDQDTEQSADQQLPAHGRQQPGSRMDQPDGALGTVPGLRSL